MSGITSDAALAALASLAATPRLAASVALTAAAVKLMDDTLDRERDAAAGRPNWAARLGVAAPVYALAFLAAAALLHAPAAGTLFLAAYALGMLRGGEGAAAIQPSRLPAWQESLLAVALGAAVAGPREMFGAVCVMLALQAADDLRDHHVRPGLSAGWAGATEVVLAGVAAGLLAILLTPAKALASLLIGGCVIWLTGAGRVRRACDGDGVPPSKGVRG